VRVCETHQVNVDVSVETRRRPTEGRVSLYTILRCTILYGVWHTNGGSEGGRILRNGIAIVLHPCEQCRWEEALKGRSIRAQRSGSEIIVKAKGRVRAALVCVQLVLE